MKNTVNEKEQLIIGEAKTPIKTCAFTGHRTLEKDFSARKLKKEIKDLIERGADTFLSGMAMGFDLLAAECVLHFKKKYPHIRLVACIPCANQEKNYSEADKKRYVSVLKKADEKILLCESYYRGCMSARNRYMADRADVLVAYLKKETGGTAYTVNYFGRKYPLKEKIFL